MKQLFNGSRGKKEGTCYRSGRRKRASWREAEDDLDEHSGAGVKMPM